MIDITGKTHIIFDFDKTLFWLDLDWDRYFDGIESHMQRLDSDLYDSYMRDDISWGNMQNMYVERFGSAIRDKIASNSSVAEKKFLNRAVPHEELIEFVKRLDSSITLSIWSSNSRSIIEATLTEHGLLGKFKSIASRSDVSLLKPSSDGFFKIHDNQTDLSSYLMIGDSDADRLGAATAGIDFHLVTMPQFR